MNEHVIIIGSTSPLASEATSAFLARGDKVSLVSRSGSTGSDASNHGVNSSTYLFDLNNLAGIPDLFKKIVAENGPVTRICFFQRYRGGADNPWDGEYAVSLRATSKFIEEFKAQPPVEQDRSAVIISSPQIPASCWNNRLPIMLSKQGCPRWCGITLSPWAERNPGQWNQAGDCAEASRATVL